MVRLPSGLVPTVAFAAAFILVAALAAGPHEGSGRRQQTPIHLSDAGAPVAGPARAAR